MLYVVTNQLNEYIRVLNHYNAFEYFKNNTDCTYIKIDDMGEELWELNKHIQNNDYIELWDLEINGRIENHLTMECVKSLFKNGKIL